MKSCYQYIHGNSFIRYLDDHTRVGLEDTNGFLDSDYINANYMAVSNSQ